MLKKTLALVLTLAMLLGTLSGLALISSAATPFAYASYISGKALYNGAEQNLMALDKNGGFKEMTTITGNEDDRYAFFMTDQNDQLGIKIPGTSGLGSTVTVEVEFWASDKNLSESRLGMNFTSGSHNNNNGTTTDYGQIKMAGTNGAEGLIIDSKMADAIDDWSVTMADGSDLEETGWKRLTIELNDANLGGGVLNFVNWSSSNGSGTGQGWYVRSILAYNTGNKPADYEYKIREDVVGYYDFAYEEGNMLTVTGGEDAEIDDTFVKKVTKANNYALTVVATEGDQPAIIAQDTHITLMAEVKEGDDGEWKVLRTDITNNDAVSFDFGALVFADCTADVLYVRKVVAARTTNDNGTELIVKNTSDGAYVNFANPFYEYNDFDRVVSYGYNADFGYEKAAAPNENDYEITDINGQTAFTAPNGYLKINLDDAYTVNGGKDIADFGIKITYFDKGTGKLKIQYNQAAIDAETAGDNFKNLDILDLTDTEEWKTATVYLTDAAFRNAANGADFRIPMGDAAIASVEVTVGADKTQLIKWANKAVNTFNYTAEAVAAFTASQASALTMIENKYATAEQVAAKVADMQAKFADLENHRNPVTDKRFTLTNAIWTGASKDANGDIISIVGGNSQGEVVKEDGWFCWQMPSGTSGRYIGIAPEDEDTFAETTSITYEYDVKFVTTCPNDRVFLGYGSKVHGWVGVNDRTDDDRFNGFQAAGSWNPTPAIGTWGTLKLVKDDFDPTLTSNNITGAITTLGAWIDNDDKTAEFYVRAIRVYDTNDKSKCISLEFHEDVTELEVTAEEGMNVESNKGFDSYALTGDKDTLEIGTAAPIADGVVKSGANDVTVAIEYYLENSDNANEKLTLTYGDGKTAVKTHDDLTIRNNWIRTSFVLTDANFGSVENLKLSYTDGSKMYIRGIKVYAPDSEKPASWGTSLLTQDAQDHAYVDWGKITPDDPTLVDSYGLTWAFREGNDGATAGDEVVDGQNTKGFTEKQGIKLYLNIDESVVDESVRYVRLDITHTQDSDLYVEYNYLLPEGTDDASEPNLSMYRFHTSSENKVIKDVTDQATGETSSQYTWITNKENYVNPLGVIRAGADPDYEKLAVTSIYLKDTQFRGAANGDDLRILTNDYAYISRVEVRAITEEDYNAAAAEVGDKTELKAAIADAEAKYGNKLPQAVKDAQDFVKYNVRASQEDVDAALAALNAALSGKLGDVNGDGEVDTTDARLVLQYAVEKITADKLDLTVANVTKGDDIVDTTDARLILQYAVEKITVFPCEE